MLYQRLPVEGIRRIKKRVSPAKNKKGLDRNPAFILKSNIL
jgi:hypothetical protein